MLQSLFRRMINSGNKIITQIQQYKEENQVDKISIRIGQYYDNLCLDVVTGECIKHLKKSNDQIKKTADNTNRAQEVPIRPDKDYYQHLNHNY